MAEQIAIRDADALEQLDIGIHRAPEVVLEEAHKAAAALKKVIDAKPKKVIFNEEAYLEFEDWQTVGRFYGISPRVTSTKYVTYDDARGWEATADAVHLPSGRVVSSAEAMCLNDEEKWRARPKYEYHYVKKSGGLSREDPGRGELIWEGDEGKKRPKKVRVQAGEEMVPLFQLRSMAQTRASAKAMRNALAWVVVLAGYKPTPAEELPGHPGPDAPAPPPPPGPGVLEGEIVRDRESHMRKATEWPVDDTSQDAADRSRLVDSIKQDSETLGLTEAHQTLNWKNTIGANVRPEDAPIDKLLKLAASLAAAVTAKAKAS